MSSNKKKSRVLPIFLGIIALLIGIIVMCYPLIAEWVFEHRLDSLIETYKDDSDNLEDAKLQEELDKARIYNEQLYRSHVKLETAYDEGKPADTEYEKLLDIQKNGIMGYIRIPVIDVELPIYHGVSDTILQNGVGHLEGSSLPVGGENTHAVLTGHTGLNRARLFTDLTQLKEGDQFYLYVLNEKMAYEVDQIQVVLPEEAENLEIEPGKDYCTLVTCTPYGVNSHRLLVRGHRVEYKEENVETAESAKTDVAQSDWMKKYYSAAGVGMAIIFVIVMTDRIIAAMQKKKKQKKKREKELHEREESH